MQFTFLFFIKLFVNEIFIVFSWSYIKLYKFDELDSKQKIPMKNQTCLCKFKKSNHQPKV